MSIEIKLTAQSEKQGLLIIKALEKAASNARSLAVESIPTKSGDKEVIEQWSEDATFLEAAIFKAKDALCLNIEASWEADLAEKKDVEPLDIDFTISGCGYEPE